MGAWDSGNFENDSVLDWLGDLEEAEDGWAEIGERLLEIVNAGPGDYLDSDPCCQALAADEVIAAAMGRPHASLPENATKWVEKNRAGITSDLAPRAKAAAQRIREKSEPAELWGDGEEDGRNKEWEAVVLDLENRLGS